MAEKDSINDISSKVISDLRNLVTVAGILGGVCYFIGYLIMNFYLSRYGVHYASLVQARYFTTGFLYLLMSLLVAVGPITIWLIVRIGKYSKTQCVFLGIVSLLLSGCTVWALGYFLINFPYIPYGNPYRPAGVRLFSFYLGFSGSQLLLWLPIALIIGFQKFSPLHRAEQKGAGRSGLAFSGMAAQSAIMSFAIVLVLILSIYSYAIQSYSQIPATFGGGAPKKVQLILSDPAAVSGLSITTGGQLSEPLILIDQTDRMLLVQDIAGERTMELSTSLVLAIIHEK